MLWAHRSRVNAQSMASRAVGVAEAVGHEPPPFASHRSPQHLPARLAVQIDPEGITGAISVAQGRQLDVYGLPASSSCQFCPSSGNG